MVPLSGMSAKLPTFGLVLCRRKIKFYIFKTVIFFTTHKKDNFF